MFIVLHTQIDVMFNSCPCLIFLSVSLMNVICLYKLNGLLYCLGAENGTALVKVVPYSNVKNKEIVSPYLNAHSGVIPHFKMNWTVSCEVFTGH